MIKDALKFILAELNASIDAPAINDDSVVLGNLALVDANNDAVSQGLLNKVVASVVNIQEEAAMRNLSNHRTTLNAQLRPVNLQQQPELYLNIYILFGANFTSNYENALLYIGNVIGFFQKKKTFDTSGDPILGPVVKTLVMDLYSMNFTELNQLWGILGGKYVPSALYKMKMVVIQKDTPLEIDGIVESIQINANVF